MFYLKGRFASSMMDGWVNPLSSRRRKNSDDESRKVIFYTINNIVSSEEHVKEFRSRFLYGEQMEMWRKGNIKQVHLHLDHETPNFLWISTQTKSFLIDLAYTTLHRCDYELEKYSKLKDYIVLKYFEEEIPLLFLMYNRNKLYEIEFLFRRYLSWCRLNTAYPPYISRVTKVYLMEKVKRQINQKITSVYILRISQLIGFKDENRNRNHLLEIYKNKKLKDLDDSTEIDADTAREYFRLLHCHELLEPTFKQYCQTRYGQFLNYEYPCMSLDQFKYFLQKYQNDNPKYIAKTIYDMGSQHQMLSFNDFCEYLYNSQLNYAALATPVDEELSLTDYFCYSSHNTYLTGNQLYSDCKVYRYIEDLMGGVKCVEIDVHDGPEGTPIVTHGIQGKSLCSAISFEDTIRAIAKFSKENPNHYPIILSIENQASGNSIYQIYDIFVNHFADKIFNFKGMFHAEKPSSEPLKCQTLNKLRGRILIKTDCDIMYVKSYRKKNNYFYTTPLTSFVLPANSYKPLFEEAELEPTDTNYEKWKTWIKARKYNYQNTVPQNLYLPISPMSKVSALFKSPSKIDNLKSCGYESSSLQNTYVISQWAKNPDKILEYTRRSWLRTYPSGKYFLSNNYDPVPMLEVGAQIIALNTQTKDDYAWLLRSYFTAGREIMEALNIGYIDKPINLRTKQSADSIKRVYTIRIISQDNVVSMKFFGTEADMVVNAKQTNRFEVKNPNYGFIMFVVNEVLKDCLPLRFIRQGYRVIIPKTELFLDSGRRVLIHITFS